MAFTDLCAAFRPLLECLHLSIMFLTVGSFLTRLYKHHRRSVPIDINLAFIDLCAAFWPLLEFIDLSFIAVCHYNSFQWKWNKKECWISLKFMTWPFLHFSGLFWPLLECLILSIVFCNFWIISNKETKASEEICANWCYLGLYWPFCSLLAFFGVWTPFIHVCLSVWYFAINFFNEIVEF